MHVRNVIFKGHCKDQLSRFAECLRFFNSQRTACLNSLARNRCAFFSKAKQQPLNNATLNVWSAKFHTSNASSNESTSENKALLHAHSPAKQETEVPLYAHPFNPALVEELLAKMENDMPVSDMLNPFEKSYRRCFLCRQNVKLDHKNVRLLSQFVSPYTGRIYGRAITGLCIPMQKHVAKLIKRARSYGLMPVILKDPKYLHDPQPYDPMSKKNFTS